MSSTKLFSMIYYKDLKNILLAQIDLSRRARIKARQMFSILHLRTLYIIVVYHIVHHDEDAFDILQSNRRSNQVEFKYRQHLLEFLNLELAFHVSLDNLMNFMTSIILMNAYLSRMHRILILVLSLEIKLTSE